MALWRLRRAGLTILRPGRRLAELLAVLRNIWCRRAAIELLLRLSLRKLPVLLSLLRVSLWHSVPAVHAALVGILAH